MKKLLLVLLITSSFFIGCGEKRDTNENKELEQKYEKMHRAKWKERQKEKGNSYTYRDYQKEEIQKELDNPTYKIVSLKHCDIPVRDFVELEEKNFEGGNALAYMDESFENKFTQYHHSYTITIQYTNESRFIEEVKTVLNHLNLAYENYEYNNFKIYSRAPLIPELGIGNSFYIYGVNTNISIGNTTEKEIKYMIDYCNKTKKK